jgi:hypothetical protein
MDVCRCALAREPTNSTKSLEEFLCVFSAPAPGLLETLLRNVPLVQLLLLYPG